MISVPDALAAVLLHKQDYGAETVELAQTGNRVLAQEVRADRDFPAYHRVTMDGIAIKSEAFHGGRRHFRIAGIQAAGQPPMLLDDLEDCLEVMTGAVLPPGSDAVIPYEDCEEGDGGFTVKVDTLDEFQNIHRQGTDAAESALLLRPGIRIRPAEAAILATVGAAKVSVRRLPRVLICSSGDELVDVDAPVAPHQIRQSNRSMLQAALHNEGIHAGSIHLRDDIDAMKAQLSAVLPHYDVILMSGAVSRGKFDFLPRVLTELGLNTFFHRVAQKPGKPFLFGMFSSGPVIFGFPGNPVSTLVCFSVYFLPWLHASLGLEDRVLEAVLTRDIRFRPALDYHLLVRLSFERGMIRADPAPGANSGDMISLIHADGFLTLPAVQETFKEGSSWPLSLLAPCF
jgi:molybdopterin molybdotransferase